MVVDLDAEIKAEKLTLTFDQILEVVCDHFDVSEKEVRGPVRERHLVVARHLLCYLAKHFTPLTLVSIGNRLNRDHTSVIYALSKIDDYIVTKDEMMYTDIIFLTEKLKDMDRDLKQKVIEGSKG